MRPPKTLAMTPTVEQISTHLETVSRILAGNVSFGSMATNTDRSRNIQSFVTSGTTGGAGATFTVSAGAGNTFFQDKHVPWGFIVVNLSAPTTIYAGVGAWTSSSVFLASSAGAVTYTIILL